MNIPIKHPTLNKLCLVGKKKRVQQIHEWHFRKPPHNCFAGNFSQWTSLTGLLMDQTIHEHTDTSVCIEYDSVVGWALSDTRDRYEPSQLEPITYNSRATGLRVKLACAPLIRAPLTRKVTIVYKIKHEPEDDRIAIIIQLAYPGDDVNIEAGDITTDEGLILFDRTHPGIT